jgi:pimeloyl-ACP methyl ester carboxylesterase
MKNAFHAHRRRSVLSAAIVITLVAANGCRSERGGATSSAAGSVSAGAESMPMTRAEVTGILAAVRKVVTPNGIDELRPLAINGINQWVSIRGKDRRNPILLVLHGGPGSPTMPAAYTFQTPWEDYFTVVEWDQRGAGKTYAANELAAVAPTMTMPQMTSDADSLIAYLRARFNKQRIFLLGHSWGSALGVAVAQQHPDWLYAYVGVGQIVDMRRSETEGYEFALREARAHHDTVGQRELASIAPYPGAVGTMTEPRLDLSHKWLMTYGGLTYGRSDFEYDANAWRLSPDYTARDLATVDSGSMLSLNRLLPTLDTLSYEHVTNFRCPVFLFLGRHDYAVSHTVAAEWFTRIHAPTKKLVWFENSAHMAMQEEPGRFLYHLLTDVRPIAVLAGDGSGAL